MDKYKIGDKVWRASYENREIRVPCPVCFGKMVVTLILGNDEALSLPCDYCGKGYKNPRGSVTTYETKPRAELVIIKKIETESTEDGDKHRYFYTSPGGGNCYLDADNAYATEKEAALASEALAQKVKEQNETRAERVKSDVTKSFSWNAGYHRRCAKDNQRQLEHHEKMAAICKDRSK